MTAGARHRGWRDRSGNIAILFAGSLTLLMTVSALGVDAGTMFLEKRRLQGIADAAALAAASDIGNAQRAAQAAVDVNRDAGASLAPVVTGSYAADPAIAGDRRFQAGGGPASAARVTVTGSVPTFFARAFTRQQRTVIVAKATAARIDLAAFSIGSRALAVQGGLANAILSGLAGTDLGLTVLDYNGLAGARIDMLGVATALRASLGPGTATFGEALSARVSLPVVVRALATGATDGASAATLRAIAAKLPDQMVSLAGLIDLGPLGENVHADPDRPIDVGALATLRAVLELGNNGRQVTSTVDLGLPGIASTQLYLQVGARAAHAPWLAVSAAHGIIVRTAQTRLLIRATLAGVLPFGLTPIVLPLYVDLAPAEATLAGVSCAAGRTAATATLDVTPSLGQAAIADVDPSRLGDFSTPLTLEPVRITGSPLATVTAFANVVLGGTAPQSVAFGTGDIAIHQVKTVSTNDLTRGIATSLLDRITIDTRLLGLGLNAALVTATVGTALAQVAPTLDQLIDQVGALAGVRLGQADVWIDGVRCGTPTLVG